MVVWLVAVALAALALLAAAGFRVRRYSRGHLVGQLAICGIGFFFCRTPDGTWWKLRLRRRRACRWPDDLGELPPEGGVREPRSPTGRGPGSGAAGLELPL